MRGRDLRYGVSLALLGVGAFSAGTGLLSLALDLTDFVYHRYSGYVLIALASLHVYLNWTKLAFYLRRKIAPLWRSRYPQPGIPEGIREVQPKRKHDAPFDASTPGLWGVSRRGFLFSFATAAGGFLLGQRLSARHPVTLAYGADVGEVYHEWSKPRYLKLLGTVLNWGRQPPLYKEYAWAEKISLPPVTGFHRLSVEEAIETRRSVRDFSGQPMSMDELSYLLHAAGGITGERWGLKLRAAPSAGALYPVEIYPVVHNVSDLEQGVYHYAVQDHSLKTLQKGDFRWSMIRHGVGQEMLGAANAVFLLTAIFQRTRWKYRERSYRYVLLEAGHIGQNIYLAATSMGLGACAVGAFFDEGVNRLLEIDGKEEAAVYIMVVGKV